MASELETKSVGNSEILDPIRETLEREFERQLGSETKNLDPAARKSLLSKTATLAIQFSGPIPPGFILKDYEEVLPGSANRIIAMAEKDQAHIHALQKMEQELPHRYATLGMFCGAAICALSIGASALVTINGYPVVGSIIFGTTLAAIVGVFVKARLDRKEADQKPAPAPSNKPKRRR